jgi:hypothetical protein
MNKTRIFQLMHKYGKLTSCNSQEPAAVDVKFVDELEDLLAGEKW